MWAHDFDDLTPKSSHPSYLLWNTISPWLGIFDCEIEPIIAHAIEPLWGSQELMKWRYAVEHWAQSLLISLAWSPLVSVFGIQPDSISNCGWSMGDWTNLSWDTGEGGGRLTLAFSFPLWLLHLISLLHFPWSLTSPWNVGPQGSLVPKLFTSQGESPIKWMGLSGWAIGFFKAWREEEQGSLLPCYSGSHCVTSCSLETHSSQTLAKLALLGKGQLSKTSS